MARLWPGLRWRRSNPSQKHYQYLNILLLP